MPGKTAVRVFISYARKDAADLAQRLHQQLTDAGLEPWLDIKRIAGGAVWTTDIEHAIDTCDVALALLSSGSFLSDICRAEQLRALRKRKRVIPVLAESGTDIPLHLETKNYRNFTDFGLLLQDIQNGENDVPLKLEFRTTYITAPPLPRNYLQRPDALESLRNALLSEDPGPSIAITALKGMGGIGKTVLAQALCHDEVVQQAFPDGIVWITAGKESAVDLVTRFREVGKALKDDLAAYDTEIGSKNRYRNMLREKAALIVVDDVWDARDIEPFLAECPRSRLLFTTRDGSIAAAVGADQVEAGLLTTKQSRELLAKSAKLSPDALPLPEAGEIIRESGRLPLALSMIGAMLRDKPSAYWSHVLHLLRSADLAKIRMQFPNYPHTDLLRAIQVSVDALDSEARRRYLALAVLLEDMPVHPAIQQFLWNAEEFECLETAEQFVSLSLAQRDTETGGIRLHDLQLDFIRAQHADRESLRLIHGAVRLSANVLARDPSQFISQVVGRLLLHQDRPEIRGFGQSLAKAARKPWLRALQPALHPPGTALLRTLEGHSSVVTSVALSADGRRAISASQDDTLKVWDLETGREVCTLPRPSSKVAALALSADGERAVSASHDHTLKVWDLQTSREICALKGHSSVVSGVALSADGWSAISASYDKTLKVWDLQTGRVVHTLEGHLSAVNGVALSANGRCAVSASEDETLKIWDLTTGRAVHTLKGHSSAVNGVALSTNGRVVSASHDHTLKVWDLETGYEMRTMEGHVSAVSSVALSADGSRAVSASWDNTLKVWDLETGRTVRTLEGHSSLVTGVAMSLDGSRAVSASWDNTLKVWDLETERAVQMFEGHFGSVNGVALNAEGSRAVSASWDNNLKVWDLKTGRAVRTLKGHSGPVNGVALSADGVRAVSASWDGTVKVWDLKTGRVVRTLEGHSSLVTGAAVSPDGRCAVSASHDKTLKVWDLQTGFAVCTLAGHSDAVNSVAVTDDWRYAVSASDDKTLKVWDLQTGLAVYTLEGHTSLVTGVAVAADGLHAVSASWDNTLKVWDLETGREVSTLEGHSGSINAVTLSPDSWRAISTSYDKTLKVWDVQTGDAIATFTADATLRCCAIINDQTIIAGDTLGHVHFLKLELPQARGLSSRTGQNDRLIGDAPA